MDPVDVLIGAAIVAGIWAFLRWRGRQPEFPPLQTAADDPLMLAALEQARSTLGEFRRLLEEPRQHALVKVRFVSSTDQVELLWGEVIEAPGVEELGIQLVTPPVTHVGRLEPVWRCTFADVEDWQVRDAGGKVHGGFTQRAMFAIARRDGVTLPPALREQEQDNS